MKTNRTRSIYAKLTLSIAVIIIIPILFSGIIGFTSNKILINKVNNTNNILLSHFKEQTDDVFEQMTRLRTRISTNDRLIQILSFTDQIDVDERWTLNNFASDLQGYALGYSYLDEYYVHVQSLDIVITDNIIQDTKNYHEHYVEEDIPYTNWLSQLSNLDNQYIKKDHYIYRYIPLPVYSRVEKKGSIFMKLNTERLLELAVTDETNISGDFFVLSVDGEILYQSNYHNTTIEFGNMNLSSSEEMHKINHKGEDYFISSAVSDQSSLIYVYAIPKAQLDKDSNQIQLFYLIGMLLYLIICILVGYLIIIRSYKPVNDTIKLLNGSIVKGENEFRVINDAIRNLIVDYNLVKSRVNRQQRIYQREYVKRLLRGRDILSTEKPITFKGDYFLAIGVIIDDIDKKIYIEENMDLILFTIENVLQECLEGLGELHVVDYSDLLVGLINVDISSLKVMDEIKEGLKSGLSYLEDIQGLSITLVISETQQSVERIPIAYEQLLEIIEFKYILGDTDIIEYDHIRMSENDTSIIELDEFEVKAKKYIKYGNVEETNGVINEMFDYYFLKNPITPQQFRLFKLRLNGMIIRVYDYMGKTIDDHTLDKMNWKDESLFKNKYQGMKETVIDILDGLIIENVDTKEHFIYKIKDYIQGNYRNIDLNISTIGEAFSLSPFYVSKLYKDAFGEGILDTITKTRIKASKDLLINHTVEEVAILVGYNNVRSFTRGFKKIEDTTPGKYKKEQCS